MIQGEVSILSCFKTKFSYSLPVEATRMGIIKAGLSLLCKFANEQ